MKNKTILKSSDVLPPKRFLFSLQWKMLLYFGLLFLVMFIAVKYVEIYGLPFTNFSGQFKENESAVFQSLNVIADLKKERLVRWIKERRDDSKFVAESNAAESSITHLLERINEERKSGVSWEILWRKLQEETIYQDLLEQINLVKEASYGVYETIQIADAETGMIIVSTQNTDRGKKIPRSDNISGSLFFSEIHVNTFKESQSDKIYLDLFHSIRAAKKNHYLGNKAVAIVIMRVNSDEIIKPLLYTGAGLGRSGEVLLVDQDLRTLMSLKYPLPDGTFAQPLEYKLTAQQTVLAARGVEGITIGKDYRKVMVLAAYRHIRITPEVRWGMVVKIDRTEVFSPLRQNLIFFALIGIISIIAVLLLTFVIAGTISHPISLLSQAAQQVQAGNLNARVPFNTLDEVGVLSATFNSMIQRIGNWHKDLEDEVQTRTAQLSLKNEELAREISERKRVEGALLEERDRAQRYLDVAGVMLIVIGADQKLQLINRRGCEILGYKEEEIIGKKWFDHFVPERNRERLKKGFQNVTAGKTNLAEYFESPLVTRNGREKIMAWHNGLLKDETGNITAILSSGEDIDLRKRAEIELRDAEIRYRTLFEESPEGVMIIDPETALPVEFNNTACQQLGYSREEFAQLRIMDYEALETTQETKGHIEKILREGSDTFETKHRCKDGGIRDVLVMVKIIKIMGRDLFLVIFRDFTERKRAEEELKRMAQELARSNVELQQFAYVVSHDLQEPLLTVSGYCQLIQRRFKGKLDEDAEKFLAFAVDGAAKMQMLIQDLLTYSRVGSGEKDFVSVDCTEVLCQVLANLKAMIEKSGATITYDPLPTTTANSSQLVQLFQNLIANAIKFQGQESPRIHISSQCQEKEWLFSVSDNGIGFDPKYANQIFVIFHRLHSSSEYPGTGIGLATCKKIVERHGGRIWVESQPGKGSFFYFTIPKQVA